MTSPDRTDQLVLEMLSRRAGGDPPADLVSRTLLALAAAPRPKGANHSAPAPRATQRRGLLLAATLVVAVPALVAAMLAVGPTIAPSRGDDAAGAAAGASTTPSTTTAAAAATPSASAETPPSTGESPKPTLTVGSIAAVTLDGDRLRVRSDPTTAGTSIKYVPVLPAGTRMLVVDGPVFADGMEWYEVRTDGELIDLYGWVSTGHEGATWLAPRSPRCPETADAAAVATLNRIDFLACFGDTQVQVKARAADFWDSRVDTSDCGWVRRTGSCDVDARWLLFPSASVTIVTAKGNEHQIDLAMPPDLAAGLAGVPRQATLLLTVSMDAPEAASCGVRDPVNGAELIPAHRAVTACRLQFVVQQIAWRDANSEDTG